MPHITVFQTKEEHASVGFGREFSSVESFLQNWEMCKAKHLQRFTLSGNAGYEGKGIGQATALWRTVPRFPQYKQRPSEPSEIKRSTTLSSRIWNKSSNRTFEEQSSAAFVR
jgi:hypothetical protein